MERCLYQRDVCIREVFVLKKCQCIRVVSVLERYLY